MLNKIRINTSGYVGAATFAILAIVLASYIQALHLDKNTALITLIIIAFLFMLTWELLSRSNHQEGYLFGEPITRLAASNIHLIRSTFWRYTALISPWLMMNFLIQHHYFFQTIDFQFSRQLFSYITWVIIVGGIPYIHITLRYRGHRKFEFNDYAMLLLLLARIAHYAFQRKPYQHILHNRRSRKIILIWLITLFFLPLMLRFYNIEFSALQTYLAVFSNTHFSNATFYQKYDAIYHILFHLIFVIDVGIAIIAYTISSRWLDNRVKSVDSTMSGWVVALICYPPLNSAFTNQFIGYTNFPTHPIFHSEVIQMILWAIILFLFSIYVWATTALGFKFSNLCNRGIISSGPYRYFRHPAYTCKNLAWWFDSTHVLSNPAASAALFAWNIIYILRGVTEEKHLKQDSAYKQYCSKVTGKFLPRRT